MKLLQSRTGKLAIVLWVLSTIVLVWLLFWVFKEDTQLIQFHHDNNRIGYDRSGFTYFVAKKKDENTLEFVERYKYVPRRGFMDGVYLEKIKTKGISGVACPGSEGIVPHAAERSPGFIFTDVLQPVGTNVILFYTDKLWYEVTNTESGVEHVTNLRGWSCYEFTLQRHNVVSTKMLHETAAATLGKYAGSIAN